MLPWTVICNVTKMAKILNYLVGQFHGKGKDPLRSKVSVTRKPLYFTLAKKNVDNFPKILICSGSVEEHILEMFSKLIQCP